jgi:hypothetical protein
VFEAPTPSASGDNVDWGIEVRNATVF